MIRYAQLLAVGLIVGGSALSTESTLGGPSLSRPPIVRALRLHDAIHPLIDLFRLSSEEERRALAAKEVRSGFLLRPEQPISSRRPDHVLDDPQVHLQLRPRALSKPPILWHELDPTLGDSASGR
ncbi:MAG TPA: hypothetical protein VH249_20975 [Xanthobacteraceae bacterium]|jgi:hypothetical protein|nr:hypothetical protein [Xanthobacteraceae bacterium]